MNAFLEFIIWVILFGLSLIVLFTFALCLVTIWYEKKAAWRDEHLSDEPPRELFQTKQPVLPKDGE